MRAAEAGAGGMRAAEAGAAGMRAAEAGAGGGSRMTRGPWSQGSKRWSTGIMELLGRRCEAKRAACTAAEQLRWWRLRLLESESVWGQNAQEKGRRAVCRRMWRLRLLVLWNVLPQCGHSRSVTVKVLVLAALADASGPCTPWAALHLALPPSLRQ